MSKHPSDGFSPDTALARAMERRLRDWSLATGATAQAARAAAQAGHDVVRALALGHVCILVEPVKVPDLLASGVVSRTDEVTANPLVLDADNRLYLARYHDYEQRLARALAPRALATVPLSEASILRARTLLDGLFASSEEHPDWQKLAVAMGLSSRLTLVSGGPGTGKTSTVVRILACLLNEDPLARIALAAPTGKAAARMHDAVMAATTGIESWVPALRQQLPERALTLHRLLGYEPARGFRHHAGHPLPVDVLVVDEASMLDLALATRVCEALPRDARLILLGDKDQLAAVEAGAIFAELAADATLSPARRKVLAALSGFPEASMAATAARGPGPLADQVVWLTRTYRFASDSGIHCLAQSVREGDAEGALALLADRSALDHTDLVWWAQAMPGTQHALAQQLLAGYAEYLDVLAAAGPGTPPVAAIFAAFNRFRVLCATRVGTRGVTALNALLADAVQARLQGAGLRGGDWFIGRPVMVLRNDHGQQLFNGDIGIALPAGDDGGIGVHFQDGEQGYRIIPPARLPEHDTAFAMTVHKAQGSEFDAVALVLPPGSESPVVTRELIYTGITRARAQVILCAEPETLRGGILRRLERRSGLPARLREACAAEQASPPAPC